LLFLLLACVPAQRSVAQTTTSLLPDADLLPARTLRLRGLTAWTRYDELLGLGSPVPRNIASPLLTDSLGPLQVPSLGVVEAQIRAAAGLPTLRVSAGNVVATANSRILTAPLIIEYGITNWMTLGVVVPLVETRTTLFSQINPQLGAANIGPNPALLPNASAVNQNAILVQQFRTASATLQNRLTTCQGTPSDPTCSGILAQQSAIQALIQSSGNFTNAIERLYGTDRSAHPGLAYVPLDLSPAQAAINTEIQTFATQYKNFLGAAVINGKVTPAAGPAGQLDFQNLLNAAGYDSLTSTDHTSIGDVSVGLSVQLLNTYGDTSAAAANRFRFRVAANGTFRVPTGQLGDGNRLFDLSTGYHQLGIAGALATDMQFHRRLSATATASYTAQLGNSPVVRVPATENAVYPLLPPVAGTYSAGNVFALSVVPRIRLAGYLAVTGQYSLLHTDADRYTITMLPPDTAGALPPPTAPFGLGSWTAQQIGVGFTYSSIIGPSRHPGGIPFEVSYLHLETLTGTGGPLNKTFRDQIELRIYWKP
jgi:hypothetical protein